MSLPKWATLFAVAGGCGIGVGCMALLVSKEKDKLTNQAGFVAKAVRLLQEQQVASELLGNELKIGKASLSDGWGQTDKLNVRVRVPVKGERDDAFLYAYARRSSEQEKYRLYKLEATFSSVQGKKLILMDRTNQEDPPEEIEKLDFITTSTSKQTSKDKTVPVETKDMTPEEKKRLFADEMKSWEVRK